MTTAYTQTVDDSLLLYAALYDTFGNYLGEQTTVWTSANLSPVVSATDSAVRLGFTGISTGTVMAGNGPYQPDTVQVTINGGVAVRFVLRVVGGLNDSTVLTTRSFQIEVKALDRGGNVAANYSGVKQLLWQWLGSDTIDFITRDTADIAVLGQDTFKAGIDMARGFRLVMVGQMVVAVQDTQNKFITGLDTIWVNDGTAPIMIDSLSYSRDRDGDGYLDGFDIVYAKPLVAGIVNGSGGFSIDTVGSQNSLTVIRVEIMDTSIGAGQALVRLYCVNSGAGSYKDGRKVNTDTDVRPVVRYAPGGAIQDQNGNQGSAWPIMVQDGAGPVVIDADYNDNNTEGTPDDDVLQVWLSEDADPNSWQQWADSVSRVLEVVPGIRHFGVGAHLRDSGDPSILEVEMGSASSGSMALLPGVDSVRLAGGVVADLRQNAANANNRAMVIHMPEGLSLVMSLVSYPNPFRAGGTMRSGVLHPADSLGDLTHGCQIKYVLSWASEVELSIYSVIGKTVLTETIKENAPGGCEGVNLYYWNGSNAKGRYVESGSYVLVLKATGGGKKDKKVWKIGVMHK